MNGKSGVRVMINGKAMQLPIDVIVHMLEGISASNVKELELMSTPPAEYDAEGNAGIIHIVTKENIDIGTMGSFGLIRRRLPAADRVLILSSHAPEKLLDEVWCVQGSITF
jgi:hypothetical protein